MLTVSFPSVSSIQNKRKEYHSYINIFAFAVCSTYICKSLAEQKGIPLIHKTLSSEKSVPQHVLWPVCEQATNAPQKIRGHSLNIAMANTRILQQQLGTTKPKSNSQYIYVCPWDITWHLTSNCGKQKWTLPLGMQIWWLKDAPKLLNGYLTLTYKFMLLTNAGSSILHKAIIACAQVGAKGVHAGGVLGTWSINKAFVHICIAWRRLK